MTARTVDGHDTTDAVGTSRSPHQARPAHPDLFEPRGVRADNEERAGRWHPIIAVIVAVLAAVVLLSAVFIGLGLLVTHFFAHSQLGRTDEHVNVWLAHHRSSLWNSVSLKLTTLADVPGIIAVAGAVTIFLLIRRWGRIALFLLVGLVIELAVFEVSEHIVARPRPRVQHLGVTPPTYSWPSGHTAAVLVLYVGIALLVMAATRRFLPRLLAWILAVVLTFGVAWSRVYEGEHHLTDAIGGILLGASALCAAVAVLRVWGRAGSRNTVSATKVHEASAPRRVAA